MRLNYLPNHLPKRIAPRPGARFGDVINDIYIFKESLSSSGGEERMVRPEPPPAPGALAYPSFKLNGVLGAEGSAPWDSLRPPSLRISISRETFPTLGGRAQGSQGTRCNLSFPLCLPERVPRSENQSNGSCKANLLLLESILSSQKFLVWLEWITCSKPTAPSWGDPLTLVIVLCTINNL